MSGWRRVAPSAPSRAAGSLGGPSAPPFAPAGRSCPRSPEPIHVKRSGCPGGVRPPRDLTPVLKDPRAGHGSASPLTAPELTLYHTVSSRRRKRDPGEPELPPPVSLETSPRGIAAPGPRASWGAPLDGPDREDLRTRYPSLRPAGRPAGVGTSVRRRGSPCPCPGAHAGAARPTLGH
jgi:hypothetical protein